MVEFKDEPCPCGISACAFPKCPQGDYLVQEITEATDDNGEIAMTGNTRDLIERAESAGLVVNVRGKFKAIEPGCLNSVYRVVQQMVKP